MPRTKSLHSATGSSLVYACVRARYAAILVIAAVKQRCGLRRVHRGLELLDLAGPDAQLERGCPDLIISYYTLLAEEY